MVTAKKKRSGKHRSNSTKVTALTMLKRGNCPFKVSRELDIPPRHPKAHLDEDPFLTPAGLQCQIPVLQEVSKETIRSVIAKDLGLPSRTAAVKPFLTDTQKVRRLDWAQRKRAWSQRRWRKILWSDETHIELWRGFRHGLQVRRSSSVSRYDPRFIRRSVKHPPKLMIWGCFGNGKLGKL